MSTPESVVVVTSHAHINGGSSKVALDSAIGLAGEGLAVTVFAATGPVAPELADAGVEVVCLGQDDLRPEQGVGRSALRGLWNRRAADTLGRILAGRDPDTTVVHTHSLSASISPSVGPVLTAASSSHVFTMHDFLLACPTGTFFHHGDEQLCDRRPLGAACLTTNCDANRALHKGWRVARQLLMRSAGRLPRGLTDVIYLSRLQHELMAPHIPASVALHHVPNPVPTVVVPRAAAGANDAFLFVGRICHEKGAVPFARAAAEAGVRAVFVGSGPDEDEVRRANPDAELVGWVSPDEVAHWMQRARCLVFPSIWYETFGLVAYEALANGLPVVCGSWSAATEAVVDGVTGWTYDEPDQLAAALQRVTVDEAARISADLDGRRERYRVTRAEHSGRLLEVYERVLRRRTDA